MDETYYVKLSLSPRLVDLPMKNIEKWGFSMVFCMFTSGLLMVDNGYNYD
jgi:hypothetical protein